MRVIPVALQRGRACAHAHAASQIEMEPTRLLRTQRTEASMYRRHNPQSPRVGPFLNWSHAATRRPKMVSGTRPMTIPIMIGSRSPEMLTEEPISMTSSIPTSGAAWAAAGRRTVAAAAAAPPRSAGCWGGTKVVGADAHVVKRIRPARKANGANALREREKAIGTGGGRKYKRQQKCARPPKPD